MLRTIVVALIVLWLVSVVLGQSFGGAIHLVLLLAILLLVVQVLRGRSRWRS